MALAENLRRSQPPPIAPIGLQPVYSPATPFNDNYLTIGARETTFTPVNESAQMSVQLASKALHGAVVPDATSAPVVHQWDNPKATGVTLTPNVTSPHPVTIVPVPVVFTAIARQP